MSFTIYYDGDCPFCTRYVAMSRLRAAAGPVTLIDLRQDAAARARLGAEGLDPDTGMVVETPAGLYHGADAVHAISAMSSGAGLLNRLAATLFRHRALARLAYPVLRAGRNAALLALGRSPMRAADPAENAGFEIFARFFGLFLILNVLYYMFRATAFDLQPTSVPLLLLGLALVVRPAAKAIFVLSVLALAADSWLHAPVHSNHTMLANFLIATFLLGGAWHMLRGSSWETFFAAVRPTGRVLLLIMYTFGIFHKINTDFLNPETSCAVALWREMPAPLAAIDTAWMHYLAIYGTFVVEGVIMLMLIVPRWRHLGIIAGIGFHALLAQSGYAMYPVFTTLAIVLHILYLPPAVALRISRHPRYRALDAFLRRPAGVAYIVAAIGLIGLFARDWDYRMAAFVWLLLATWPLAIIAVAGFHRAAHEHERVQLWSPTLALNLIPLVFFLNCLSPYFGLKTAQSMNMFANLRLEGGVSNHLVFRDTIGPFTYLDDIVLVTDARGSATLTAALQHTDISLVYYEFLDMLEDVPPQAEVAFVRGPYAVPLTPVAEIMERDGHILHPEWVRKVFHFLPVMTETPRPC